MCLQKNSFENTVGKGEIACNKQFVLFPTEFSTLMENSLPFSSNFHLQTFSVWMSLTSVVWKTDKLLICKGQFKKGVPYVALLQGIGFLSHT